METVLPEAAHLLGVPLGLGLGALRDHLRGCEEGASVWFRGAKCLPVFFFGVGAIGERGHKKEHHLS